MTRNSQSKSIFSKIVDLCADVQKIYQKRNNPHEWLILNFKINENVFKLNLSCFSVALALNIAESKIHHDNFGNMK
jgi:hypothetical protein